MSGGEITLPGDPAAGPPLRPVLIAESDPISLDLLLPILSESFQLTVCETGAEALARSQAQRPLVLIVGEHLGDMSGVELAAALQTDYASGWQPTLLAMTSRAAPWPDELTVFHYITPELQPEVFRDLVVSAADATYRRDSAAVAGPRTAADAQRVQHVLTLSRSIAFQRDAAGAGRRTAAAIRELAEADRAYCLFYDQNSGTLWSSEDDEAEHPATAGLSGFAARTGTSVECECASEDLRYRRDIDDPHGRGDERLLVAPVLSPGREVQAVLIAVRSDRVAMFGTKAREQFHMLAEHLAPTFHRLDLEGQAEALLATPEERGLFRAEALEAHDRIKDIGSLVQISPVWLGAAYAVVGALIVAAIAYMFLATVNEYSTGTAVVRMAQRAEVTAPIEGTVTSIDVERGEAVRKGDILLTLGDALQDAALDRVEREWQSSLREYLANPSDEGMRKSLAGLRARRQHELARVEQRIVRAPRDGVIANLRVNPGQHLGLGQTVLSIVDPKSEISVIALLPGADRALLRPDMQLRVELPGYRDVQETLRIDSVDDEIIGPEEANRYLGEQLQGSFALSGPIAVVRARLDTPDFVLDGRRYRYRDGMPLAAEVPVRERRLYRLLLPGD